MNTTTQIRILNMKPVGHYYKGGPIYDFATSYPSGGVRLLDENGDDTPESAYKRGVKYIQTYEGQNPYAHMGECLGVALKDGKYYAVVNTYYSPS